MKKLILCLSSSLFCMSNVHASTHFTVQGSSSFNNLGLNNEESRSASASIAQDLGSFLRIGVTHRQGSTLMKGYKHNEVTDNYDFYSQRINSTANSLDLTIVLYYGEVFMPYLQVGAVKKDYEVSSFATDSDNKSLIAYSMPPVPSAGFGLGIKINTHFSLKLSYTVSPGIRQLTPSQPAESILDSYTAIGITYDI